MKYPTFLGSDVKQSSFEKAFFHFIPVPLEKSVSYGKGTKKAPLQILTASHQLETFDGISDPSRLGFYTHKKVNCLFNINEVYKKIDKILSSVIKNNNLPIILGGEHTVTSLVVKSLSNKIKNFGVVHFDAHADLKDTYQNNPYSHACALKRIFDLGIPIVQFGTRSLTLEEQEFREKNKITYYNADYFFKNNISNIKLPKDFPKKIYITIDVDVFDPSLIPATGTPEPGGLLWYQVISLLEMIIKEKEVIGFDLVELAPIKKLHFCEFTVAKLIYTIMGFIQRYQK